MKRAAAVAAVVAAGLVLAFVVLRGGDKRVIEVPLQNASGLKDGSAVRVYGLIGGRVDLELGKGDQVVAKLTLDDTAPAIHKDASAEIVAANFLGQKRIELDPGKQGDAPAGFRIPAGRVSTPTDLDQVLNVLDLNTRMRLQVLLSELGQGVVGRKFDLRTFLREFPIGVEDAARDVELIKTDNATMRALIERSDRFVAAAAGKRRQLDRLVDTVGTTAQVVNARRAELRETLARAPGTLRTLREFAGDLQRTTVPLGPAAYEISAASGVLNSTLRKVEGFRKAATPTLATAARVAPGLTRLARGATPVLRQARAPALDVARLAETLPEVSQTLLNSADNIVPILENWSRAIQFRDQLGHVFRGEASFSPDFVLTMVDRLTGGPTKRRCQRSRDRAPAAPAPQPTASPAEPASPIKPVHDAAGKLPAVPTVPPAPQPPAAADDLLDFLLG